ncbi:hypothetical protein [Shinella zoogloeoides]|uniref:hypothetical protein n=1 Tax=Shinella zoogloeoides TaxID=352475 RepID=UPI001F560A5F|nr:hypothetical protein [Shinella zoogloeoides]
MNRRTILKGGLVLAATAHTAVASGDKVQSSPQERIDAAIAEIEQAMSELYAGWQIDKQSRVVCPQSYVHGGGFVDLPAHIHAVMVVAHDDSDGLKRDFRFHYNITDLRT